MTQPAELKVCAIVPMRHSSERVPGKNYRNLGRMPLFEHILTALVNSNCVSEIVVDTDSELITEILVTSWPEVKIIERPEELRSGSLDMNSVLTNTLKTVQAEFVLQTHSTNPFLKPATIDDAVNKFFSLKADYDSLFSVTRFHGRLWDEDFEPVNHSREVLLRTQDLPPLWEENSCMYIFSREQFLRSNSRIGTRPYLFETGPLESHDIDTEADFSLAEAILSTTFTDNAPPTTEEIAPGGSTDDRRPSFT
jgi:CMP-N-acetylneuraminic acid synthetase